MKRVLLKLIPWLFLAVFATEIVSLLLPRADQGFHVRDFGRLPVLLNGRVQPLDSVGRNALLQIRGTAAVPLEEKKWYEFWKHPRKLKASEWLLEVMVKPEVADTRPLFLIHHPDLLSGFNLQGLGVEKSGLFYFSFNELTNSLPKIETEGRQVMGVEAQARTAYQNQLAKLYHALGLYHRIKNSLQPETTEDFAGELETFLGALPAGIAAFKAREAGQAADPAAYQAYVMPLSRYEFMSRLAYPLIVPLAQPGMASRQEAWQNMGQALLAVARSQGELPPAVTWLARMASAYRRGDAAAFNQAQDEYRGWLAPRLGAELRKSRLEFFFNDLQAFLHAMIIYLFAFVLAAVAMLTLTFWPNLAESLRRSAFWLILLALVVHTAGLLFRMYLERRPPVTNLYSSAIFIGWMAAVLGVFLERVYRVGIGAAAASLVGAITLIIAHNLALGGDTMEMLRAVLDTNFWLATHVVTITLGYAANFMAGLLAILYLALGILTPLLSAKGPAPATLAAGAAAGGFRAAGPRNLAQALDQMVYGIICFATLFSFIGTVLGGIWADQSWGRFWGWDPKENGALIIVIWNALILHARWAKMVEQRGLMALAIFGNIVTAFSWFGVNMLGIGLHSYGFMDAAFKWLLLFIISQAACILVGLLPQRYWRSFRPQASGPEGP